MSVAMNQYKPDYAVHPGTYLDEVLVERGITKADFARRCGITPKTVSQILNQNANFSTEVAIQFEKVLGISAEIWLGMLSALQLLESRHREAEKLESAKKWARNFPLRDLRKVGVLPDAKKGSEWVGRLLSFFNVSSPEAWNEVYRKQAVAFRKSPTLKASEYAIATWLRLAENQAAPMDTDSFSSQQLREILPAIRALTVEKTEHFEPRIVELCKSAGVAVVFVPELTGTRISGAAKWLEPGKAMVALSLRHKTDDHFWFTLFHEIGHVLLHGKRDVFIDGGNENGSESEREANAFARDTLVPTKDYEEFIDVGVFYEKDILRFARQQGIAPGIVVGMLQHDREIEYSWHNSLKRRFEFASHLPGVST